MVTQYGNYIAWGRTKRSQDWVILILSIWLFISPWVLGFGTGTGAVGPVGGNLAAISRAAWDAWVLGVIVFLVSLSALGSLDVRQEWISLVLGAWIFAAPWALGFTPFRAASWDHWIVGALIFLLSVWIVSAARNIPLVDDRYPPAGGTPPGNRVP